MKIKEKFGQVFSFILSSDLFCSLVEVVVQHAVFKTRC